jgi:hypothetical protein
VSTGVMQTPAYATVQLQTKSRHIGYFTYFSDER